MSASKFLILGAVFLLLAWSVSSVGLLRAVPNLLRTVVTIIFVLSAVRVGLSIAIIAFDSSPISLLIPTFFGIAAWWLRPKPSSTG